MRAPDAPSAEIIDLTQRMRRWRGLTVDHRRAGGLPRRHRAGARIPPDVLPPDWRPKQQVVERVVEKPVEVVQEVVREVPRRGRRSSSRCSRRTSSRPPS